MEEKINQSKTEKSTGTFGDVQTFKNYIGLHLKLNTEHMKQQKEEINADYKKEVVIDIDSVKVEMTFDEFKNRVLKLNG